MKKILVIGGTQFLGRTLVETLLPLNKYDVTLFNRGKTNAHLFPEIKRIIGDRNTEDAKQIAKQDWDCILDISCYYPNPFNDLLDQLKGKVGRYVFVSTGSAYVLDENNDYPMTEDSPLRTCTAEERADPSMITYNEKKAACEADLESKEWLDKIILRPALVVGPYDHTDRLYYWFHKVQTQDQFLIPNEGKNVISYTDVNDFARMLIKAIEVDHQHNAYNANSYVASIGDFVKAASAHLGKTPQIINGSPEFLEAQEVKQWSEMPLWMHGDYFSHDNSRLQKDFDFTFSTLEETLPRLINYYTNDLKWREPDTKGSMTIERERELLNLLTS